MNNSKIAIDNVHLDIEQPIDTSPYLRQRESELLEIIEAVDNISKSSYWKTLEQKVFAGLVESFERKIRTESDVHKVAWLQGALNIADKYVDFKKFADAYRLELKKVRQQLKGN